MAAQMSILGNLPPLEGGEQFIGGKLKHAEEENLPEAVQSDQPDQGPEQERVYDPA